MKREEAIESLNIPQPYIHCPFTNSANDIYGHLTWDNVVNLTYGNDGAVFNGSSSMLRSRNRITAGKIKTFVYYVKFNVIPTDGVSSTWQATHFFMGNNNSQNAMFGMLQHYQAENDELTNTIRAGSWTSTVLSTPYGSTQTGRWYKIIVRKNQNTTDLYIDNYHTTSNYIFNDSWNMDMFLGTNIAFERYLNGNIKDLMVWDIPLTDEQIALL